MRRAPYVAIAALLVLFPALAGAQSAADATSSTDDQPSPSSAGQATPEGSAPSGRPSHSDRLLTPEQQGRQGVVKGVMEQPFRDFNLIRSKIPPVLRRAIADPYERPPQSCEGLRTAVDALNVALGPDLDEPVSTEHPGTLTRVEGVARTGALDAMRSGVQSQIPFDGFIRMLTGAQRHDKLVMAAIQAGAIRRGYLKGMGEAHGCAVPATPRHLAHPISVAAQEGDTQSASDGAASRR
jgi:hypothetical protein